MLGEWTDLNDAGSLGSGYVRDDIDRLFHPDPEPPLAPFGALDESPFGGTAEGGSHPPSMAPGTGSSYAAAEMTPGHHAGEGFAAPHDGRAEMANLSDATAGTESVTFHGSFTAMQIVVPPTRLSGKWRSIGRLSAPAGGHNSFFRCLPCQ